MRPSGTPHPERDAGDVDGVQRRTLRVVFFSQMLGGAGLAAGITVGALLAEDMADSTRLAGAPTVLFTLGSALAAFLVGSTAQRHGRRIGLVAGFATGGVGAIGVVAAAAIDSLALLFLSLFIYGAGMATNLQARYAGTDLAKQSHRGRAISVALVATTAGAVAGPNLVEPLGTLAQSFDLPALAGPFLLAAAAYLAAAVVLFALLRPDPILLARQLQDADADANAQAQGAPSDRGPRPGTGAYVGAAIMVLIQLVMIAVMTMTPVHMRDHAHSLGAIGFVIGVHVGAMFLPSPITGMLVDRVGRSAMVVASGVTLLLAGVTAAFAPTDSVGVLTLALALLGLGWNFGLISGTALIVDATVPANRARTQGTIDVLFALAGATGGGLSAVVMSATSYDTLALIGGGLGLAIVPFLAWMHRPPRVGNGGAGTRRR